MDENGSHVGGIAAWGYCDDDCLVDLQGIITDIQRNAEIQTTEIRTMPKLEHTIVWILDVRISDVGFIQFVRTLA